MPEPDFDAELDRGVAEHFTDVDDEPTREEADDAEERYQDDRLDARFDERFENY